MVTEFIKRVHEQQTTMQIRNEQIAGSRAGAKQIATSKATCNYWKKHGSCRNPDTCKFQHPANERGSEPPPSQPQPKQQPRASSKGAADRQQAPQYPSAQKPWSSTNPKWVCTYYLQGKCKKSHKECPFVHNPTCTNFQQGHCERGDKCLFPHRGEKGRLVCATPEDQPAPSPKAEPIPKKQAKPTDQPAKPKP